MLATVLSRLSALEKQNAQQISFIENHQEQIKDLTSLKDQIFSQRNEIDDIKIQHTSQQVQISSQRNEIEDLKKQHTSQQDQITSKQNEIEDLKKHHTSQQEQITKQQHEILNLKIQLSSQHQYIEKLENRVTADEGAYSKEEIMSYNVSAATPEVRSK